MKENLLSNPCVKRIIFYEMMRAKFVCKSVEQLRFDWMLIAVLVNHFQSVLKFNSKLFVITVAK